MTDSDVDEKQKMLRTDALGRVQSTREQREAILDEFERSALSGPQFAEAHGINYQTFATWRQKRKQERGEYQEAEPDKTGEIVFLEVTDTEVSGTSEIEAGLTIELPAGARMVIRHPEDAALAAEIIRRLGS